MSDNPLKIINEIVAPDLTDERFSDSLNEAFALINDNFKKIVSAPIYRGQQGENTKIKEVVILNGNQFTDEGKKIVKVIFTDANLDEWDGGFESLKSILADIDKYRPIGSKSAADYFKTNDKILMFYLDNVEETLLAPAQLYTFQDERIEDIAGATDGFEDATCFVSFEWDAENKTYTYVKVEQFPTIAWSTTMGDYVWKINGQLTNIIAKGLKGADAHFYIPMFKAFYSGNIWNAVAIYSGGRWRPLNSIYMDELQEGMTSIVYIIPDGGDENTSPIGIEITTIQRFDKTTNPPYVHLNYQGVSIEVKPLDTMMDEIRPATEASIRETIPAGLYIPADGVGNETVTNIHALWRTTDQSTCTEANFGYAKKNDTGIDINDGVTTLNIHNYQTIKFKQNDEEYGYMWINNDGGTKEFKTGNGNSHIIFRNNEDESVNHIMFHTPGTELMIGNSIVLAYGLITGNVNIDPLITNGIKIDGAGTTVIGGLQSKGDFSVDFNSITVFKISFDSNNYISLGAKIKTININTDITLDNEINVGKSGKTVINIKGKNIKINDYDFTDTYSNGNWTTGGTNKLKPYRIEYRDIDKNGKDWTSTSSNTDKTNCSIEVTFQSFGRFGFFRVLNIESYWRNNEKGPTTYAGSNDKYGTYNDGNYTWDVYDDSENWGLNRSRVVRLYYDVTEFFKTNEVQYIPNVDLGNYVPGNVGIYSGYMGCGIHITASVGYIPVEIAGVTKNRVILHICISHDYVLGYVHTWKNRANEVKNLDYLLQYISYGFNHSLGNASFPIPIRRE